MRPRRLAAAAVVLALAAAAGCASDRRSTATPGPGPRVLRVVTTTTQLTDFATNIGGRNVKVYAVIAPNVDPHDYEPTPADLEALGSADVIVKNGLGLEKWFEENIENAGPRGTIVDASEAVPVRSGGGDDEHAQGDPHIWHNPQNAKIMVANIAHAFEGADPSAASDFEANLAAYSAALDTLDASIKAQVDTLPNKKLVTNHDAFGYYVDHYGFEFVGALIPSFDTQAELSPADVNTLVAKIKAEHVKAVFSEASLPAKTAEAIAREAGVRVVAGGDALYGDSLGPKGSDGDTYLKMMAHNTKVIVDNLR